jgi:hypothetical protein
MTRAVIEKRLYEYHIAASSEEVAAIQIEDGECEAIDGGNGELVDVLENGPVVYKGEIL